MSLRGGSSGTWREPLSRPSRRPRGVRRPCPHRASASSGPSTRYGGAIAPQSAIAALSLTFPPPSTANVLFGKSGDASFYVGNGASSLRQVKFTEPECRGWDVALGERQPSVIAID